MNDIRTRSSKLGWCEHCKESSIVVEVYRRKSDGAMRRVEYCINAGHGYRKELPYGLAYENNKEK